MIKSAERVEAYWNELDPNKRLAIPLFGRNIPGPLILGSGTLVEIADQISPYLENGAGAVVPRTTRFVMERKHHPSPHLYESGRRGNEIMLNAEWTGADVEFWKPHLEEMAETGQVIMSISGRDIPGCTKVAQELDRFGFPYLEINISCAHSNEVHGFITRNGDHITRVVREIKNAGVETPIAIKLGHSDYIVELAQIAKDAGSDAIVAVNTFGPVFDFQIVDGKPVQVLGIAGGKGGMSGSALFPIALTDVAEISRQVEIPVIACGGVSTAEDVLKMIMAGAVGVQVYTSAHVRGVNAPKKFSELNTQLIRLMGKQGIQNINDMRGAALNILGQKTNMEPLVPDLDIDKCTGCDICIPKCLPQAIEIVPASNKAEHIIAINDACIGCGHCIAVCPVDALRLPITSVSGQ